jgi:hypothetical protein
LFWRNRDRLGDLPDIVKARLTTLGLSVDTLQTAPSSSNCR